jgi:CheY-like chemotaxis protein
VAKERKRFLVLDDDDNQREAYADDVRDFFTDSQVDTVGNKNDAITFLREKTYHAALLDIMLTDSPDNTEGLDVLEFIRGLNEGTRVVMLSASERVDAPVRALRSRIAVDYIIKEKKKKSDEPNASFKKPEYIAALERAISECHIPIFGSFGRLTSYLAAPDDPNIWEYDAMTTLGAQGMESLSGFLSEFMKPLFPLLPLKGAKAMATDKDRQACYAAYWSKALAKGLWICLARQETDFHMPPKVGEMIGPEHRKQKIKGGAWDLPTPRSEFLESIWDVGRHLKN